MDTHLTQAASSAPGDVAWSNPSNCLLDTATYASADIALALTPDTQLLVVTGPVRKPPATARVHGVTMWAEHLRVGLGTIVHRAAQLVHGGSAIGSDQSAAGSVGASKAVSKWGGPRDTMGATLTPAIVRAATFGAQFGAECTASTATIRVFRVWLTVHHRPERHARQREFSRTRGR
jgi:hypothetical protein